MGIRVGRGGCRLLAVLTIGLLAVNVAGAHAQQATAGIRPVGIAAVPTTLRWGPQRPDLLRFNRVEALSIGARAQIRPSTLAGPVSITATARLGSMSPRRSCIGA